MTTGAATVVLIVFSTIVFFLLIRQRDVDQD